MTGLCFKDFCHVPRPKKVLLRVREGRRSRSIGYQHCRRSLQSVHTLTHTEHSSLTWTWTLTFTCTHLYTCTALVLAMPTFQYITKLNSKHTEIEQACGRRNKASSSAPSRVDGAQLGWEPSTAVCTPLANWVRESWLLLLALWP